jgi:hypothetical protein
VQILRGSPEAQNLALSRLDYKYFMYRKLKELWYGIALEEIGVSFQIVLYIVYAAD